MRRLIYISLFCSLAVSAFSQQDEQFTHFMYHKLGYNPAYAGAQETPTFYVLARQQWMGIEGAPQSQLVSFNTPLTSKGVGIGGIVSRHTIGATSRLTAEAAYTYRFNLGVGGRLGIGVSTSVRLLRTDFDQLESTQPRTEDSAIPTGIQSKYVPNFGAGIYYSNQIFYVGFSSPRLLENNIDLADESAIISTEIRHMYLMAGILVNVGEKIQIQPQMLLKYVKGAPFDGDMNVNFIFDDRIYGGLSYRLGGSKETGIGEAGSLLFGVQITESLLFGLSYDYTLSELRSYSSGSMEGMIRYTIGGRSRGTEILSPRFF